MPPLGAWVAAATRFRVSDAMDGSRWRMSDKELLSGGGTGGGTAGNDTVVSRRQLMGPFVVPVFGLAFCGLFLYESRALGFREAGYPRVIIGVFVVLVAGIIARECVRLRRVAAGLDQNGLPVAREPEAAVQGIEPSGTETTGGVVGGTEDVGNEDPATAGEQAVSSPNWIASWRPTVVIAIFLTALVWLMPRVGSILAIAVFSLVLPPLLGYRRHVFTIAACLITVAITYFIFVQEFGVPLP